MSDNFLNVKIKIIRPGEWLGEVAKATPGSAGVDLRAWMEEDSTRIPPGERVMFPTGLAMEIGDPGVAGFIFSRSGLGTKEGLVVSQGVGVVDPDYRGEIKVSLLNTSESERLVRLGQRIAQIVFMPVCRPLFEVVDELSQTRRGQGGFGHTGRM